MKYLCNKKRKRLLSIICFVLLAVTMVFTACGSDEDEKLFDEEEINNLEIEETSSIEEEEPIESAEPVVDEPIESVADQNEESFSDEEISEEIPDIDFEEAPEQSQTEETKDSNGYSFVELSAVMYASSGLNVRDLPDKSGNSLGKLSRNEEIYVTGQCNETSWYRIDYAGQEAYVSNEFVSDSPKGEEKPAKAAQEETGSDSSGYGVTETSTSGGGGVNNFDTYDNPEQQQTSASYVLNTNTMKFHLPNCSSVAKIAPQNYATANDRSAIVGQGYEPCKKCNP